MAVVRSLLFVALVALPSMVFADPPAGQIDPTFGDGVVNNGVAGVQLIGFDLGGDWDDFAHAMTADADGRLLLAGVASMDDEHCLGLMRFTSDGRPDVQDFGFDLNQVAQGKICHPLAGLDESLSANAFDIAVAGDGTFFVGGSSYHQHPFVCRFYANGAMHSEFGAGGCIVLSEIEADSSEGPKLLLSNSSVLVVTRQVVNGAATPVLTSISKATGSIELLGQQSFVPLLSSSANASVVDAILSDDGDVIAVGAIEVEPGDFDMFVARFDLAQLEPDDNFQGDGMLRLKSNEVPEAYDRMQAVTNAGNGTIFAAGTIDIANDRNAVVVVQLDAATGAQSEAFGGAPRVYTPCDATNCPSAIAGIAATENNIVVVGDEAAAMFAFRLSRNGEADEMFGESGHSRVDFDGLDDGATGLVMQDERIVLTGTAERSSGDREFVLLRLSDGRLFNDQFEDSGP